jgi:hypothetical protein
MDDSAPKLDLSARPLPLAAWGGREMVELARGSTAGAGTPAGVAAPDIVGGFEERGLLLVEWSRRKWWWRDGKSAKSDSLKVTVLFLVCVKTC